MTSGVWQGGNLFFYLFTISEFLTKDYSETYYKEDGTEVTTTPNDIVSVNVTTPKLYATFKMLLRPSFISCFDFFNNYM